jgi:hypothetical protein
MAWLEGNKLRMSDASWQRHANPWSVYTRLGTVPLLVLAVWSRVWIGWWSVAVLAGLAIWLALNVRVFAPVNRPRHWLSRGIYGERLWLEDRQRLPACCRRRLSGLLIPALLATFATIWGSVTLSVAPALARYW